ncbi:hypothetical protein ACIQ9Q_25430 [Streptomyces sp. NPDC094438]|uniref:hypothetical protein n=1 Tax=Streptomyces sp. NPDC094438 TaxID=3366061 RepID=UPI0037FF90AB
MPKKAHRDSRTQLDCADQSATTRSRPLYEPTAHDLYLLPGLQRAGFTALPMPADGLTCAEGAHHQLLRCCGAALGSNSPWNISRSA